MHYRRTLALAAILGVAAQFANAGEPPKAEMARQTPGGLRFSWQEHPRPWHQQVLWYLPSRGADLLDVLGIEFGTTITAHGIHPGVHGNIHLTRYMQLGIGRVYGTWAGMMGRHPVVVEQDLDEQAIGWCWRYEVSRKTLHGATPEKVELSQDDVLRGYHPEADPLGIGGTFFFGAVGMSFELKLTELLDLLTGFVTLDPRGDDY